MTMAAVIMKMSDDAKAASNLWIEPIKLSTSTTKQPMIEESRVSLIEQVTK